MPAEPDNPDKPWRSKDVLMYHYHDLNMTYSDISDKFGCSTTTISNWMGRFGIESRWPYGRNKANYAAYFSLESRDLSYEVWNDNNENHVRVHRLLAVAEYGFDKVADKHVHHKNKIPWDNRPENIEVLTPEEHGKVHGKDAHPG